jgi:hypothetical protein
MCRFLEGEERAIGYFHPAEPSNKPLEWTGHPQLSATPLSAPCLPLRGSVRPIRYLPLLSLTSQLALVA